jgi:trk system potassium uptake protein
MHMDTLTGDPQSQRRPRWRFRILPGATAIVALRRGGPARATPLPGPALVVVALAGLIAVGTVLLLLPPATVEGRRTDVLVALFTATSAACTTGLVLVDTADHWTLFGQAVILVLCQVGGLGFLTASTLILLVLRHRLGLRDRLLARDALGEGTLGDVGSLVRRIVRFALVTEAVGAILLALHFWGEQSPARALWFGVFLSVSAFTNASFDLFGGMRGLTAVGTPPLLLLTLAALVILGGISYSVVADVWRTRGTRRLLLDTKLVLLTTGGLLAAGWGLFYLLERSNPASLGPLNVEDALIQSFFWSVVPRSAGFQTFDPTRFNEGTLLVLIALMVIGGAAGSTAGGIKVNSVAVIAAAVVSAVKGRAQVTAFWREIPTRVVMRALTVTVLAFLVIGGVAFAITVSTGLRFVYVLFEATSAFGTVGLSIGVLPELATVDRVILIAAMFLGRLGPLTLAVALARGREEERLRYPEDTVRIG